MQARWTRLYPVELPGKIVVGHGDIAEIPAGEAKASDNWEIVKAPAAPRKPDDGKDA